jgi:hypothetical protein
MNENGPMDGGAACPSSLGYAEGPRYDCDRPRGHDGPHGAETFLGALTWTSP